MRHEQKLEIMGRVSKQDIDKATNAYAWISALVATDLKQGQGMLGNELEGFCCLGLGCHVLKLPYEPDDGESDAFQELVGLRFFDGLAYFGYPDEDDDGHTPSFNSILKFIDELGLERENIAYINLVAFNDSLNMTFKQIAKVLKRFPHLFFEDNVADVLEIFISEKI